MDLADRWIQLSYQRPLLTSSVTALVVAVSSVAGLRVEQRGGRPGDYAVASAVIVVLASAFLIVKRIRPVVALIGTAGGALTYIAFTGDFNAASVLPLAIALCAIASMYSARVAVPVVVATLAVLTAGAFLLGGNWLPVERFGLVAWPVLGASIGGMSRARNRYVTAVETRAQVAAVLHEVEVERRLGEERLRVAREIHDVVSASLASLNLQIGTARLLLDKPEYAEAALAGMHENSQNAIREIKELVRLLRTYEREESEGQVEKMPGMEELPILVQEYVDSGVEATLNIRGSERPVLPEVGFTIYRVVQESMTNAVKHAPGATIVVDLVYRANTVVLDVTNDLAISGRFRGYSTDIAVGGSFGLVGMEERVRATGGWFHAGPADGRFAVSLELPLPVRALQEQ